MPPSTQVHYLPIPEGDAGLYLTLERIASNIRAYNPLTDDLAESFPSDPGMTETETAAEVFSWVQAHLRYLEEPFPAVTEITDAIATPDAIVDQLYRYGYFVGDCAHASTLLAAIYRRLGFDVTLVWIRTNSPSKGREEDHVYPVVSTDEGPFAADAIVDQPFGWSVPADEELFHFELPV